MGATIEFTLNVPHDIRQGFPKRRVESLLDDTQLDELDREGCLVLPGGIPKGTYDRLLAACDRLEARIDSGQMAGEYEPGDDSIYDLEMHDEAFSDLVFDPLLVSTARTMMGPSVRVGVLIMRSYRNRDNPGVPWHTHRWVNTAPLPRWWSAPSGLEVLHYLEGSNADLGRLAFVPGSHRDPTRMFRLDYADYPDQRVVEVPAGSLVLLHSALAHKGIPSHGPVEKRRIVGISFMPTWYKAQHLRKRDRTPWVAAMAKRHALDPERLELLGIGGAN